MPTLSTLRIPAVAGVRSVLSASSKTKITPTNLMQVRHGGGGPPKMVIRPSSYIKDRFKDDFYFYMVVGLAPVAALITYLNVRYGPAELQPIPDDYVPQHWEYYKDPVSRFTQRYRFRNTHEKEYERHVYFLDKTNQHRLDTMKMLKVKEHMKASPAQKEWYMVPDSFEDRKRFTKVVRERQERGINQSKWI